MASPGKYNQYLQAAKTFEETYFGGKVQSFCDFLNEIGLVASKSDEFVIKRRAKMAAEDVNDELQAEAVFGESMKEILTGFFEDRSVELAKSLVENWPKYQEAQIEKEEEFERIRRADKLRGVLCLAKAKQDILVSQYLTKWKEESLNAKIATLKYKIDEKDHKIERLHHDNIQTQDELRESMEEAHQYRLRLEELFEDKMRKKQATTRRKKMKQMREVSRSLAVEKANGVTVTSSVCTEDPYMVADEKKGRELDSTHETRLQKRKAFPQTERGSVDTVRILRRKKLQMSKASNSLCASSVYSKNFNSNLSFHPEINRDDKWIPKYDDHHNHKRMLERMHNESRKIERKKRIMSSEKQQRELSECSFTPKINAKDRRTAAQRKKLKNEDASNLTKRMYEYAQKHKTNLEKKKESIDQERGQEINFRPKIVETKTLKIKRDKGEVYDDLYKDFSTREDKKKEKKK